MKKMVIVVFLLLLSITGCKSQQESYSVEQKQTEEEIQVEEETQVTEQKSESDSLLIKDRLNELDHRILEEIVQSYFMFFTFERSINEGEVVDFQDAFKYIMYAGTYGIKPFEYMKTIETYYESASGNYTIPVKVIEDLIKEDQINPSLFTDITIRNDNYVVEPSDGYMRWAIRPEIYQYYMENLELIEMPASVVDEYIVSKFNTEIDHSQINEYNKEKSTYSYYPFLGEFYYDISIDEVERDGGRIKFSSTITSNVDDSLNNSYQAIFEIEFLDGEYKFLSVDTRKENINEIGEEKVELYDYDKLYKYFNIPIEKLEVEDVKLMLQDIGLEVKSVDFGFDKQIKITYILDLSEKNDLYEFQRLKEVQNSIVLFSIYEQIDTVKYLYNQEGLYSNEIVYDKDNLLIETGINDLSEYTESEAHFRGMSEVIESITYTPDVMPFVMYSDMIKDE